MIPASLFIESSSMSIWVFLAVVVVALLVGFALGIGSRSASRHSDGKPWWYDVAFPAPDETTVGAMKVLADRYALGEIDAEEFSERVAALRKVSETPEQRKKRLECDVRTLRNKTS
jgi:uncharacterized membrane protein